MEGGGVSCKRKSSGDGGGGFALALPGPGPESDGLSSDGRGSRSCVRLGWQFECRQTECDHQTDQPAGADPW
jgi:hypothetical protein